MFVHSVPVPGGLELNSPEDGFCLWRCNRDDKRVVSIFIVIHGFAHRPQLSFLVVSRCKAWSLGSWV